MIRCTRCLYPDTKPDLHFNSEGVCSACRAFDKRKDIDWPAHERELVKIIARSPRNDSGYDCIIPSSGGKDSTWQTLKLIELGAHPLVVTATTCHLTEIGRKNIDNLARYATTIEVTPNRTVRAKLNRLGLELVGDISWPEHASIVTTPFRVACDLGIPLIFYGECPQNAYGGPPGTEQASEMTYRWTTEYGGFLGLRQSDMVGREGITEADMADYEFPLPERVRQPGVKAYFLGQFYEWDSYENAAVAVKHGMRWALPSSANWWHYENLDNAQTGIHDHMMYLKFGYGRLAAQASVDIRNGRMTREEGMALLPRDGMFPWEYAGVPIEEMLERLGLDIASLRVIMERHTAISLPDTETLQAMGETLLRAGQRAADPPVMPRL